MHKSIFYYSKFTILVILIIIYMAINKINFSKYLGTKIIFSVPTERFQKVDLFDCWNYSPYLFKYL